MTGKFKLNLMNMYISFRKLKGGLHVYNFNKNTYTGKNKECTILGIFKTSMKKTAGYYICCNQTDLRTSSDSGNLLRP